MSVPLCTNWGASSPLAEVVSFERRSLPLLRIAFRRASAFAFAAADMMNLKSRRGERGWLTVVTRSQVGLPFCLSAHQQKFNAMSPQDKATTERHSRTLRELVKRPENRVCADCKHNGTSISSLFAGTLTPRP